MNPWSPSECFAKTKKALYSEIHLREKNVGEEVGWKKQILSSAEKKGHKAVVKHIAVNISYFHHPRKVELVIFSFRSCVDGTMCYDSDEAAAFSISSLSNRSSPLSWRQGQASPRLQAGEAPSTGNAQSEVPIRISHNSRIHLIEALDDSDPSLLKGDYLSDSDLGGKSPNEDDDEDDVDIGDLGNG